MPTHYYDAAPCRATPIIYTPKFFFSRASHDTPPASIVTDCKLAKRLDCSQGMADLLHTQGRLQASSRRHELLTRFSVIEAMISPRGCARAIRAATETPPALKYYRRLGYATLRALEV